MKKTSRYTFVGLLIVVAVVITACRSSRPEQPGEALQHLSIVQFGNFFLYLPLYVAQNKGYFAQQGLQVKIINTGGDDKSWASVLSGDAQFSVSDPTFIAVSAQRGESGKVLASIVNGVPFWGVAYSQKV